MKRVTISGAKKNLSQLVEMACRDEDVIIITAGSRAVRLVPFGERKRRIHRRTLGILKGKLLVEQSSLSLLETSS